MFGKYRSVRIKKKLGTETDMFCQCPKIDPFRFDNFTIFMSNMKIIMNRSINVITFSEYIANFGIFSKLDYSSQQIFRSKFPPIGKISRINLRQFSEHFHKPCFHKIHKQCKRFSLENFDVNTV